LKIYSQNNTETETIAKIVELERILIQKYSTCALSVQN